MAFSIFFIHTLISQYCNPDIWLMNFSVCMFCLVKFMVHTQQDFSSIDFSSWRLVTAEGPFFVAFRSSLCWITVSAKTLILGNSQVNYKSHYCEIRVSLLSILWLVNFHLPIFWLVDHCEASKPDWLNCPMLKTSLDVIPMSQNPFWAIFHVTQIWFADHDGTSKPDWLNSQMVKIPLDEFPVFVNLWSDDVENAIYLGKRFHKNQCFFDPERTNGRTNERTNKL